MLRALMFLAIWLLMRSLRLRERPGAFALHVALFYAAAFALIATAGLTARLGPLFLLLSLPVGAHLLWQTRELDIASTTSALRLFRANRDTGALAAAAFFVAGWLS